MLSLPLPAAALAEAIGNAIVVEGQLCRRNGKDYRCGWQAALDDRIARRSVRCEKRDVGRYGRTIAGCFVGSVSLNDELVKQGWTVAYRE